MGKNRNSRQHQKANPLAVNPLSSGIDPVEEVSAEEVEEVSAEEVEVIETMGEVEEEVGSDPISDIPNGPLGGGIHPSEFDPDSEPVDRFSDDAPARPIIPSEPSQPKGTIHDSGYVPGPITVNALGNPKEPEFNPRDPSKGFYQGIDPVTGERIYSVKG